MDKGGEKSLIQTAGGCILNFVGSCFGSGCVCNVFAVLFSKKSCRTACDGWEMLGKQGREGVQGAVQGIPCLCHLTEMRPLGAGEDKRGSSNPGRALLQQPPCAAEICQSNKFEHEGFGIGVFLVNPLRLPVCCGGFGEGE